jgi:hypothetical protein
MRFGIQAFIRFWFDFDVVYFREDFCRMRQFLGGPTPAGWQDSTSSAEEDEEGEAAP